MWSGRNVPTFQSTLLPLPSGSLEGFVEFFIAKNSLCGGHALCTSVHFAAEITFTERILIKFAIDMSVLQAVSRLWCAVCVWICGSCW